MRLTLIATAVALAISACGGGETHSRSEVSDANFHLVALGTPWQSGYPVYGVHVATLSGIGRLIGWDVGADHLNWESLSLSPDGSQVASIYRGIVQIYSSPKGSVR